MTHNVHFNPFIKEIKYVDLEQVQEMIEQGQDVQGLIDGDSQDEENVEIRLLSGQTQENFDNARKMGMKEEIPNNIYELKKELDKYIEVYTQNFLKEHPNVNPREIKGLIDSADEEFLVRYMNEAKGASSISMSDVVQEFDMFMDQKIAQFHKGRNASRAIIHNERSNSEGKYNDLYQSVTDAQRWYSSYGSGISNQEADDIRENASDYIVNQMLKDNFDLLNQINPNFEYYETYREATKLLETAERSKDPRQVKAAINEAKKLIKELLEYTSIHKITNIISNNPPGGRNDFSTMMLDQASDTRDKYSDLYKSAQRATSIFSKAGHHVSYSEENKLKEKTADLIVSQLLNDNSSIGMLKALVPDYKNRSEYQNAIKFLAGIEYETNPQKVQQKLNAAKREITNLLRYTDGEDIANVVKYSAHMTKPHAFGTFGHNHKDFRWHDSFNDRFEVSRNQHRLFNAAGYVGLPDGMFYNTQNWYGAPKSSAISNIKHEIVNYANELKQELRLTTRNKGDLRKLYEALDSAIQNFDIKDYIRKHGDNISKAEVCADFLRSVQGVLSNQNRIENMSEAGSDPFNRNLMLSKHLVVKSGHYINNKEKDIIAESYAKYMLQALMADFRNARQLASVGQRNYYNPENFTTVSLNNCLRDIQDLKNNPPASRKELEEKIQKITKDLEFLIKKMDTNVLARTIMSQGAQW